MAGPVPEPEVEGPLSTTRIKFESKDFVRVPVTAKEAGVVVNPTALVVQFSLSQGEPGAFTAGAWETDATTVPAPTYFARILVGGTGTGATIEKAKGKYRVFVKVTGSPEIPVLEAENAVEIY